MAAADHLRDVGVIADDVADEVRSIARRANTDDIDAWWRTAGPGVERSVARGFGATATLAGRFLAAEAAVNGFPALEPVLAVVDAVQIANALRITGPVAFKQKMRSSGDPDLARSTMAKRLTGSTNRLVLAGSRETFAATADANAEIMLGYERVARSGACDFCKMLAGRGTAYRSAASGAQAVGRSGRTRGTRPLGAQFHDHCRCRLDAVWATGRRETVFDPAAQQPPPVAQPATPPPVITPPTARPALGQLDAENPATDWEAALGRRNQVVEVASGPRAKSVSGTPGPGVALVDDGRLYYVESHPLRHTVMEVEASGRARISTLATPEEVRAEAERRLARLRSAVEQSRPAGLRGAQTHMSVTGSSADDLHWQRLYGSSNFRSGANASPDRVVHFGGSVADETVWHESGHVLAGEANRLARDPDLVGLASDPGPRWLTAQVDDRAHIESLKASGGLDQWRQRDRFQREIKPGWAQYRSEPSAHGVTDYASANPAEDFAESWRLFVEDQVHGQIGSTSAGPVRFADLFPGRAAYFDDLARELGVDFARMG